MLFGESQWCLLVVQIISIICNLLPDFSPNFILLQKKYYFSENDDARRLYLIHGIDHDVIGVGVKQLRRNDLQHCNIDNTKDHCDCTDKGSEIDVQVLVGVPLSKL